MKNKSVLLGILIMVVVIFATGCGFYNLLESSEFKDHFGALGYTVSESEEGKYEALKYLVASKDDVPFKIEYYEFDEEIEAKKVYTKYYDSISEYITSDSQNKTTTGAVFAKTVAVSENEYIVISRVKNTLIFISGTNDYAKEIDKLLEDIEY
ncbi:MAG: hypothetical protein IJN13_01025 [Bacilli bacterium]|nr:hypothetical protein [Bacilli bacterium]